MISSNKLIIAMLKTLVIITLSLTVLSNDCGSYNPVCGTNGVTY